MGQIQCCSTASHEAGTTNQFGCLYGEDNPENRIIVHEDNLVSRVEELNATLREWEKKLRQSQKLFKDNSMRTDPIILSSPHEQHIQIKCTYERPYVFLKDATAARGNSYKIIDSDARSPSRVVIEDDILQYFGVFLCFLSKNTNLIHQIILTEPNSYGLCGLQINVGTRHEYILIDDYVLCENRKPMFSQPINGSYMWPCLLERAWLKAKGNLTENIQNNTPEQVCSFFLSYPLKTYTFSPQNHLQNKELLRTHLHNLPPTMGCTVTSKKEPLHKLGLSGRKFYFLIKVLWFDNKMLYYLRNPCGLFDFRGSLRLVTPQLQNRIRKETGDEKITDGNFLLDEEEFIEQVESFSVIYYSPHSEVISNKFVPDNSPPEIFVRTYLQSDALVSMSFQQRAGLTEKDAIYAPITYQVISLSEDRLVGGSSNSEGCFGVQTTSLLDEPLMSLKAGEYLIRIKKKASKKGSIILTNEEEREKIIATAPFLLQFDIQPVDQELNDRFFLFLREVGRRQLQQIQVKLNQKISKTNYWIGDLAVVYIQKVKQNQQTIRLEVYFPELQNLQCISHQIGQEYTALPPFTTYQLIVFQTIDPADVETVLGNYVIEPF